MKVIILIFGIAVGSIATLLVVDGPQSRKSITHRGETASNTNNQTNESVESQNIIALRREMALLIDKLSHYESTEASRKSKLDAEKAKYIEFSIKRYESLFELSAEQKEVIGEIAWESKVFWEDARAGKIDMSKAELPDLDGNVSKILTQEQSKIYQEHLKAMNDSSTETASTAFLSQIPVTLNLSDEQKDEIFKNLYVSLHPSTQVEFQRRWEASEEHEFDKTHQMIVWSAEEELTEEQLEKLKQAFKK